MASPTSFPYAIAGKQLGLRLPPKREPGDRSTRQDSDTRSDITLISRETDVDAESGTRHRQDRPLLKTRNFKAEKMQSDETIRISQPGWEKAI
jgi:hypothetical protein